MCRFRRTQAGCALVLTGRREAPLQETAGLISAAGGLPALVAPAFEAMGGKVILASPCVCCTESH